ncbi:FixH family protein [Flavobacterium aciduliphilum]|jgi:nitrogen fixation protein FixH|uniref:FixH protein n=1 Tax=Flavobacterium aciduliphilum TaxID=1101402 RepID=A0A328Y7W4_9FLAO|nr:FixH family protein [Flavobacterium aciduliphilum]RAR70128.1 FixH protein [Flavobacterium aciduliphilum]
MKINWGKGILIAFALFMGFILYFIIKVQTNSNYDNEFVVNEYYKKELLAQQDLDKEQNAYDLKQKVAIQTTSEGIYIDFPSDFNCSEIQGKVSLYRPSNQKLDFEVPLSLSSPHLLIPKKNLVGGRWGISIDWTYQGKKFLNKEDLYFKQ